MTGTVPDMAPSGRAARDTSSQYSCGVICARGLEKRFGERRVLRGVEFDVPRAGFLLVTGPNGSGKTTLLRICAGLAAPTAGELVADVERARVGFLAHEPLVYRELLVLDEPFSSLDDEGAALLDRELEERRANASFVVATHDPDRVRPYATSHLALA